MIPRLDPAANPIDVTVTVNVRLRPYFELWFNKTKLPGETAREFALRKLKESAFRDYLGFTIQDERDSIEQSTEDLNTALNDDIQALAEELD